MTGNTLPGDLDLLNLILVSPRPGYVIPNGTRRQRTSPPTTTTTRRPPPLELGSVTFTSGRSYLQLPQWGPGRDGRVEFKFRTIQQHGILMVTSPSPGRSDFFAVELSDGNLYALFNLGGHTQRFLIGTDVDDGRPHSVSIDRNGRTLWLALDNQRHRDRLDPAGGDDSLDLGSTLYVGGTSNPDELPWPLYARRRDFYRGCVWDLRLDGGDIVPLQQLRREQRMPGVSPGCSSMPEDCLAASCQNEAICLQQWSGHLCDCALTAYTGLHCERGRYQ